VNSYKISVNENHVTNMRNGGRFPYVVAPGKVRVNAETVPNIFNIGLGLALMGRPELDLTLEAGETYFIEVGADPWSGGPKLVPVDWDEGPLTPKVIDNDTL